MTFYHPIGDDHPFPKVYDLAQSQGFDQLEIVNIYDGALIRLFVRSPDLVFKLKGDPGSALDRQRFDYYSHVRVHSASPEEMLQVIKARVLNETTD